MKQYEITITGSGSANSLAIALLSIGRILQVGDVYDTVDRDIENKEFDDKGLTIEIKEV